ncbi:MAG TPA: formate/nitrite transporter family protein [Thermoanaerobaculia bacterium]|nr:formate/nitrite transporter family protein [Thermoanaerobaculia bacterium]
MTAQGDSRSSETRESSEPVDPSKPSALSEGSESAESAESSEKRSNDSQKSYSTILDEEIEEGLEELERPTWGLLLSGFSAGLDIGFSVLLLAVLGTLAVGNLPPPLYEILRASAYSVGFILVVFGRSELFTEHTTLASLPVLARKASVAQLARLWGLVYCSNLVGGAVFAALLAVIGPELGVVEPAAFQALADDILDHRWSVIFASAILAGWLMGLVSWLVTAGRDTISQVFFVWLVTGSIGFAHLHHCIIGSVEVLTALIAGQAVTLLEFGRFLSAATAGNILGGVFFVALVKYGHATKVRRAMRHSLPPRR